MAQKPLTDEQLAEAAAVCARHTSVEKAAKELGLSRNAMRNRLLRAAERGFMGTDPVLPGYAIKSIASKTPDGAWVKQTKAAGEVFALPQGQKVKGVSALVDADGREMMKWVKTGELRESPEAVAEIVRKAFEDFKPMAPAIVRPKDLLDNCLTAYIFCDWHIGLFAYGKETGGPDWDLSIARRVLLQTVADLIDMTPKSRHALILGLGDILHADNARNMTERSGNVLDVDTRYTKTLDTATDILIEASEMVAAKHDMVEITMKPGNHDENTTVAFRQGFRLYYRNEDRIAVDRSPNPFYYRRFGVNLIGGTHGDKAKIPDMPLLMANHRPQDWAETFSRHYHTGHIHHDTLKEVGGVRVYSHRAPVAQDHYHAAHGFLSGRSMRAFNYDFERGARGSSEVEIR